jgi:predicted DNA-binding protein
MYSPKIKAKLIKQLWELKERTGRPMTWLVNEAIRIYLEKQLKANINKAICFRTGGDDKDD